MFTYNIKLTVHQGHTPTTVEHQSNIIKANIIKVCHNIKLMIHQGHTNRLTEHQAHTPINYSQHKDNTTLRYLYISSYCYTTAVHTIQLMNTSGYTTSS